MKNRITVDRMEHSLTFRLVKDGRSIYLFTQPWCSAVYRYFRGGRSVGEVLSFSQWDRNRKLDKTITKIPAYIRYAEHDWAA